MFKKTKAGIEIDSQATDRSNAPRFKGQQAPKFGKKKARKQAAAKLIGKARKAY